MAPHRPPSGGPGPEVVVWSAPTEADEAGWIANLILDLADKGVPYRDIAVLVRSRAAYPRLVEQFATFDIPVQPGGRSGLFDQPEAVVLGHTIAWLTDIEWRDRYGPGRVISDEALLDEYQRVFELPDGDPEPGGAVPAGVEGRRAANRPPGEPGGELYELLDELAVAVLGPVRSAAGEPARHARPVLLAAGRLRIRPAAGPA